MLAVVADAAGRAPASELRFAVQRLAAARRRAPAAAAAGRRRAGGAPPGARRCRCALRLPRRPAAEPHALRVPGAVAEGARLRQPRARIARQLVAGGLAYTRRRGRCRSSRWPALLLALRAAGDQLGWGFQLQSPLFVAGLALLFALIGLNLLGVFEVARRAAGPPRALRSAPPGASITGSPACSRWRWHRPAPTPFMGAALGAALTLPAPQALAVFAALGAGMAAPYLAASLWPGLARWLPRPGAWMARFRTAMAFPMFATVVWLVWVLGQQVGIDGAAALLGAAARDRVRALGALAGAGSGRGARRCRGGGRGRRRDARRPGSWPALRAELERTGRRRSATRAGGRLAALVDRRVRPRARRRPAGVRRLHRRVVRRPARSTSARHSATPKCWRRSAPATCC